MMEKFKPESKAKAEIVLPILKGILASKTAKVEVPDAAEGG